MKKRYRASLAALLLAAVAVLCGCTAGQPQTESPTQSPTPSSQSTPAPEANSTPDGPRVVTRPGDMLGEPDEIILYARGLVPVLDKDSPQARALLETLAQRFPEKLKVAAAAFEWNREDGQGVDWERMAEDFDYIRLSYNREQAATLRCLAAPEGFPEREEEITFTNIIFPLTEDWAETCIVDYETYGVLEHSQETLDKLRNFFPKPAPSLEAVAAEYPIRVEVPEKFGWYVQRITGDREGFLLLKHTAPDQSDGAENFPQVYYCQGRTGKCTLLPVEGADRWGIKGERLEDGTLRIINDREIYRWRMGRPGEDWELLSRGDNPERTRLMESESPDRYSYNAARDTACWQDGRGRILYGSADGSQGEVIWDCGWPEPPYHVPGIAGGNPIEKWAGEVVFSRSGRLALFCEMNYGYQVHPVLYDLDTGEYGEPEGEYWQEGQFWDYLLNENTAEVAIAGHDLTEEHPASDKLLILSLEGQREVTLDFSYTRPEMDAGRLFLEAENGDCYEWDPAVERCIPRGSNHFGWNGNVKVEQLLVEDGYEAIRLTLGSASTLVLLPR